MEEFYIRELLRHSERLPVIKQLLLMTLSYEQLEEYCFELFDGKWNTQRLFQCVFVNNLVIPWSTLVLDRYKWSHFIYLIRDLSMLMCYMPKGMLKKDNDALLEIICTPCVRREFRGGYCFTQKEERYIHRLLSLGKINDLMYNSTSCLFVSIIRIFKGSVLKACYKAL